ncbi:MAG: hypothetical protein V1754_15700 [Pseudomonadota bacterium]
MLDLDVIVVNQLNQEFALNNIIEIKVSPFVEANTGITIDVTVCLYLAEFAIYQPRMNRFKIDLARRANEKQRR